MQEKSGGEASEPPDKKNGITIPTSDPPPLSVSFEQKILVVEEGPMPVEKTTIQDPTHLVSPETDRVRPTGNRRKLKQILHVAYVCESGHSPDLGPRSTDVSRGNHRRSTTSRKSEKLPVPGIEPGTHRLRGCALPTRLRRLVPCVL